MKILHTHVAQFIAASAWGQVWVEPCVDLENVDSGECDLAMGIGEVGLECVYISGCGRKIDGIDYSAIVTVDRGSCLFPDCISECLGDVDRDGSVTVKDIFILLSNFGAICNFKR